MASNGLPSGAFLTTINGRRCTAVPKVANVLSTPSTTSTTSTSTTPPPPPPPPPPPATSTSTTTTPNPTTNLVAAPIADINRGDGQNQSGTTASPLATTTRVIPEPMRAAEELSSTSTSLTSTSEPARASSPASSQTPPPVALPIASGPEPQSSALANASPSSQADGSVTAPAANPPVISSGANQVDTRVPNLPIISATTPLSTTLDPSSTFQTVTDTPPPTNTEAAAPNDTTSSADPLAAVPVDNNAVRSTVAVAGGVIGGVVALSILAFFIWWWRRRLLRKRRSTLLTPLDLVPPYDRDEKGGYVITRGSIGPTPVTEKVRAALGLKIKRIRGHIRNRTAPSVNLNSPASSAGTRSRSNSATEKGIKGWWAGLSKRRDSAPSRPSMVSEERKAAIAAQPDFLTLLNMDNGQLDREAQRRRASIARLNGSAGSTNDLLRNMNLTLSGVGDNPFSDANAIPHLSAKPAPLAVNNANPANPFTDANAIRDAPPTYDLNIRRSRSNSTGAGREPSGVYTYRNTLRSSIGSLRSVTTAMTNKRNTKFRSDPFDLERPELLGVGAVGVKNVIRPPTLATLASRNSSTAATTGSVAGGEDLRASQQSQRQSQTQQQQNNESSTQGGTARAARAESFSSRYSKYSAKYSSGVSNPESLGNMWSDPGPDVGPAAARRTSGGSFGSLGVGRAM
ncbi:hypothetical protein VTJ49DRAFT_4949 [Mycothermus thermophilus]|uniref:Uncharacterized protein n=1 Tax=Humicola insolens TaxID=85995 RepID=A0ABR3VR16_HUMIN